MLINITGIDGCGKTTQVDILSHRLEALGKSTFISKAFGTKEKAIYSPILPELSQTALMFLFQTMHCQQYESAKLAEEMGQIVLTDRWDDSYLAYHQVFGVLSTKKNLMLEMNKLAFHHRKADITFLLDIDPKEAEERMTYRGKSFLDHNSLDHFSKIRDSFLTLSKKYNWLVLNGSDQVNVLSNKIFNIVKKIIFSTGDLT